jgi:3-methyladenine DNA glycosylase AlkD
MHLDADDLETLRRELHALADSRKAAHMQRFFKTGVGEYGEGDRFLGIRVPALRRLARMYRHLDHDGALALLASEWHEERFVALVLLVQAYRRGTADERDVIYHAYIENRHRIDSWDLVDTSAEHILGAHLDPADPTPLVRLAHSNCVWERRMAILATFAWIKRGTVEPTLTLADILIDDPHDLIHKGVGWMLREVGRRDVDLLRDFLQYRYRDMPRTMLRYTIERFPEPLRQGYLKGDV